MCKVYCIRNNNYYNNADGCADENVIYWPRVVVDLAPRYIFGRAARKKIAHSSFVESVRWSVRGHVPSRAAAAASAAACGLRHPHGRLACHSLLGR